MTPRRHPDPATRVKTPRDVPYMFTLAVDGIDLSSEEAVEAWVSGDIEVYPAVLAGRSILTYRVMAKSGFHAVMDAVGHVHSIEPTARVCRVEIDLVSISDIASRLGRTSESVRAWVVGSPAAESFPLRVSDIGDGARMWDWSSVNQWLRREGVEGCDEEHLLSRDEIDELNVMLARRVGDAAVNS